MAWFRAPGGAVAPGGVENGGQASPKARWGAYAAIGYMALANLPVKFQPVEAGVDGSWIFALNSLAAEGSLLGREVFYTYGPFGYLLEPRAVGDNLAAGAGFWLAIHAVLLAFLVNVVRQGRAWEAAGVSVVLVLSQGIGYWDEYLVLLVVGLLSVEADDGRSRGAVWRTAASVLAALCLFMKLTLGIAAAATVLAGVVVRHLPRVTSAGRFARDIAWAMAAYLATAGGLAAVYFRGGDEVARWLEMSWEITRGYGLAMTMFGSRLTLAEAGLALGLTGILFWLADAGQRKALLVFAPAIGLSYRHAFVRQDWHTFAFFCFLPLASAASAMFASGRGRWARWYAFGISGATLALAVSHWGLYPEAPRRDADHLWKHVSLRTGFERARKLVGFNETTAALQAASLPSGLRMRDDWAERVRVSGGAAVGIPYEVTAIALQGMRWGRLPTMQMFAAYTSKLDERTAAYFASATAPEWIWIRMWNLNERHLVLDNPLTWDEILRRYRVAGVDEARDEVLLRREGPVREATERTHEQGLAVANGWAELRGDVRGAFEVRLTALGRMAQALYKLPPVYFEFEREDGSIWGYRLLSETARSGAMVRTLPRNARELADLVDGKPIPLVSRFRLRVSIPRLVAPPIRVTWMKAKGMGP
jgi:hypothetical protein